MTARLGKTHQRCAVPVMDLIRNLPRALGCFIYHMTLWTVRTECNFLGNMFINWLSRSPI